MVGSVFGSTGSDTFAFFLSEDSGDDDIFDFNAGGTNDTLQLNDVFDYGALGDAVGPGGLDSLTALGDGWSVTEDSGNVVITFGDNDGDGVNPGGTDLGTVTIVGAATGSIDSFQALENAGFDLDINA